MSALNAHVSSSTNTSELAYSKAVLRQTQAVIGAMILLGILAAWQVHIAWAILPAIVGAGLLMASLTGVCPMALVIAKLPWNTRLSCQSPRCG